MPRIIIGSYVVRFPLGGFQSWMLQWLLGFKRLGHEVYFVEKSGWNNSCYDARTRSMGSDCSHGTAVFGRLLSEHGLGSNWCFVDASGTYHGMSRDRIETAFRDADVFIDHMRVCEWPEEASHARMRVMVDGEPAYTQMHMESKMKSAERGLIEYDRYFSVGMNVGTPTCSAPSAGKDWQPMFDPVILSLFPHVPAPPDGPFSTVMSWQAIKPFEHRGVTYSSKDFEFPKFLDLPRRVRATIQLALSGGEAARPLLDEAGWKIVDAQDATLTFNDWRTYIQASRGEFSVCKNYFVATNSGAFSDRAAAYLASGRPVVMQETGFSAHLPCGRGLFAVRNVEEAAAAINEIQGDWENHSKWAREIANDYLDTDRVLRKFLDDLGL
jgi:hypothetical protein